jgi:hypothetical protein
VSSAGRTASGPAATRSGPAGEGVAKNPGQEGRFQRVGDLRGLTAWWARTETVPSRGEVRQNRPAIGATAGIEQQET